MVESVSRAHYGVYQQNTWNNYCSNLLSSREEVKFFPFHFGSQFLVAAGSSASFEVVVAFSPRKKWDEKIGMGLWVVTFSPRVCLFALNMRILHFRPPKKKFEICLLPEAEE